MTECVAACVKPGFGLQHHCSEVKESEAEKRQCVVSAVTLFERTS